MNHTRTIPEQLILAIDGRCAAGKTRLASIINEKTDCNIIHMDDFFLRAEQRTAHRLNTPGGNIDYERFLDEVLIPLKNKQPVNYRTFNCHTMSFDRTISLPTKQLNVIEGSYACHPELFDYYDLRIFLDVPTDIQMARIIERDGADKAAIFRDRWIVLEEKYFEAYNIKARCDRVFMT